MIFRELADKMIHLVSKLKWDIEYGSFRIGKLGHVSNILSNFSRQVLQEIPHIFVWAELDFSFYLVGNVAEQSHKHWFVIDLSQPVLQNLEHSCTNFLIAKW